MQFHIVARLGAVALVLTCSGCGGGGSSGSPNRHDTAPPRRLVGRPPSLSSGIGARSRFPPTQGRQARIKWSCGETTTT